jgi:hypothetical protein
MAAGHDAESTLANPIADARGHIQDTNMITAKVVQEALDRLAALKCHRGRRMPAFAYVVRSPRTGLAKIGMSESPIKRLTEIQIVNAEHLSLEALVHGAWIEGALHDALAEHRRHGEWFDVPCPIPYTGGDVCFGCLSHRRKTFNIDRASQRSLL